MKRKLGTGNNQTYALRDKEGNLIRNMDMIVVVAQRFYRDLYGSSHYQNINIEESSSDEFEIPSVTAEEVKKALEIMQRGKQQVRIRYQQIL